MLGSLFNNNKTFDRKRPDFYEGIVTNKEYAKILQMSEEECKRIGEINSIQAGTIKVANPKEAEEEFAFHLDNLVRKCKYYAEEEWPTVIKNHFSRFPIDESKAKFLAKDFEYAQPLLKVLVRSPESMSGDLVHRLDIPETHSFLILDYDERFHFLTPDDIVEWAIPQSEIFEIALANIATEKIDIQEVYWKEEFQLFTFFSGDFSASFMVELTKNAPFALGDFGAVVAIPTKGSAFVHPIDQNTVLGFIAAFDTAFDSFYHQDEVPISSNYYWFYKGKFEVIPILKKHNKIQLTLPKQLNELITDTFNSK